MFVIATARYEAGSNPYSTLFWIASGFAFAMTMPDIAFEITYCIFSEEV
jgi:hypothetical protein